MDTRKVLAGIASIATLVASASVAFAQIEGDPGGSDGLPPGIACYNASCLNSGRGLFCANCCQNNCPDDQFEDCSGCCGNAKGVVCRALN